tara:strand:- start:119 stop:568 length:450 start_codon:yes stop_codon:yes gene_type:complete
MSKILTDELIEQTMADQGWQDVNEADQDWQRKMVLDHYEVELTDRFDNNCGYYIYGETTRDGYEVFVAADDVRNVCISEDIYYYENDLHDALIDAIKDEQSPIYLDDEDAEFVDYAIEELYQELYQEKYNEVESELEDQGYEWPEKIEA